MTPEAIAECAAALAAARLGAYSVPELPPEFRPQSEDDAYDVQDAVNDLLSDAGRGVHTGWKIGATTPGMQTYLGVDGPAAGRILSANVYAPGDTLPRSDFCKPGIECEIAFHIARPSGGSAWTRDNADELVAAALPAIEIVENRYGDFLARGTPTLIADDFFHKACVLGEEIEDWHSVNLAAVAGRTLIDGAERGSGTGADVMGHPLEALAWLANRLARRDLELKPGDIVLTGSVAPVIWIEKYPCAAAVELDGLGSVSIDFD